MICRIINQYFSVSIARTTPIRMSVANAAEWAWLMPDLSADGLPGNSPLGAARQSKYNGTPANGVQSSAFTNANLYWIIGSGHLVAAIGLYSNTAYRSEGFDS